MMKTNEFEKFVIRLFNIEYKGQMTNKSSDLWNEFDNKCFEKAKELGMNIDELESDGNCLGFISDSHYKTEEKSFWWKYQGQQIASYSWV